MVNIATIRITTKEGERPSHSQSGPGLLHVETVIQSTLHLAWAVHQFSHVDLSVKTAGGENTKLKLERSEVREAVQ